MKFEYNRKKTWSMIRIIIYETLSDISSLIDEVSLSRSFMTGPLSTCLNLRNFFLITYQWGIDRTTELISKKKSWSKPVVDFTTWNPNI